MRRIPSGLVVVLLILCGLTLVLLIVRPVIVLPPITLALPESNAIVGSQQLLGISQLDLTLTTNGRFSIAANGQRIGYLSYDLGSLKNSADLVASVFLPPPFAGPIVLASILVFIYFFPQIVYTVFLAVLYTYYLCPIEITLRLIRG